MLQDVRTWLIPRTKSVRIYCGQKVQHFRERAGISASFVPILIRRPAVALLWLRSARAAQIVLLALLVTVPILFTPVTDRILEVIYPQVSEQKLFGLVQTTHDDPRLPNRKRMARVALWSGAGTLVFFMFFLHIPTSVERARARSREDEDRSDRLVSEQPNESYLLYQSSLKMTIDAEDIARIEGKIRSLNSSPSGAYPARSSLPAVPDSEKTLADACSAVEQGINDTDIWGGTFRVGSGGRYHLNGLLGHGATGTVCRACDTVLERDVAIKALLPDLINNSKAVSRFRQEAKVVAQLTHPHIVQVYDMIESNGRIWIVMELVKGGELADLLSEKGRLSIAEVATLGVQMAEALSYAHARGVVHRDLKPSNVMLTVSGLPKIMDFGLARITQSNQKTRTGAILGTPYYMSPEQVQGKEADSRSDVYAMGVVLYQMLTGRVPCEGENIASVLHRQVNENPLPPSRISSDVPEELSHFILAMLQKDSNDRVKDMHLVAKTLGPFRTS